MMKGLCKIVAALPFFAALQCGVMYPSGYHALPGCIQQNYTLNKEVGLPTDLGSKTGSACVEGWFGVYTEGNGGVQAAAAAGGIRTVKAVDYEVYSFLGFVHTRLCTVVHGD